VRAKWCELLTTSRNDRFMYAGCAAKNSGEFGDLYKSRFPRVNVWGKEGDGRRDLTDVDVSTRPAPPPPDVAIHVAWLTPRCRPGSSRKTEREREREIHEAKDNFSNDGLTAFDVAVCKRKCGTRFQIRPMATSRQVLYPRPLSCPSPPFYRPYYVATWRGLHGRERRVTLRLSRRYPEIQFSVSH